MIGLTPRQADMLSCIRARFASQGYAPSFAELAQDMSGRCTNRGQVHHLVGQLESKGRIRHKPHQARSIEIVDHDPASVAISLNGRPILCRFISKESGR